MVSAIDPTRPIDGVLASKADLRNNLAAARDEIEALQDDIANLLSALNLSDGETAFPELGGDNTPTGAQALTTILLALDAAITAASGGGGGAQELGDLSDILSPSTAIRRAFQNAVAIAVQDDDFAFDPALHAGGLIALDTNLNSVTMTLPDPSTLTDRGDGYLCSLTPTSGLNFGAITGPASSLRAQQHRVGTTVTQTTVFIGESRTSGFRTVVDLYKEAGLYTIRGRLRVTETDDLRINAAQTLPGTALVNGSLPAAAFPALLDLGGTVQTGGGREIIEQIAGNHTFVQANAGKTLEHTGGSAATWNVPALLPGTTVEVDNATGGEITFNDTGSQTVVGGTTLESGAAGAVKWLNGGRVRFIGTV